MDSLRKLEMNSMQFIRIANVFDFPVSSALLSLAFNGKRELSMWTAKHCLELADELDHVARSHSVLFRAEPQVQEVRPKDPQQICW